MAGITLGAQQQRFQEGKHLPGSLAKNLCSFEDTRIKN